jgi:5-formyltetrahydrofolate cyclo-ligase
MNKTRLRSWAKQVRRGLEMPTLSSQLVGHLFKFLQRKKVKQILLYSAFGSEPDLTQLQSAYPAQYYLPRVEANTLHIHPLPCQLVAHRYGFLEPSPDSAEAGLEVLEAILVPGLTFDLKGFRVGYGKGFYDRLLADVEPRVLTIGISPDLLIVEQLPADPWDVPVQFIASELGMLKAEGQKLEAEGQKPKAES